MSAKFCIILLYPENYTGCLNLPNFASPTACKVFFDRGMFFYSYYGIS